MGRIAWLAAARLTAALAVLLAIFTITFLMMRLAPGGPLDRAEAYPPEVRANMEARYGLDRPLLTQYRGALLGLVQGDLGPSLAFAPGRPVLDVIGESLPVSLELGAYALFIALFLGVAAGAYAGHRRGGWFDRAAMFGSLVFISASVIVVSAVLRGFCIVRDGPFVLGGFDSWRSKFLPAIALGLAYAAIFVRLVRANVVSQLSGGIMTAARARGVPPLTAFVKYVLPQSLIPMLEYMGPAVAGILTGSFIVEAMFEVPGVSACFVEGAQARDYTLVAGSIMVYSVLLLSLNFTFELMHTFLDPRQRRKGNGTGRGGRP
jgi:oligopeptide transport system permease protein